MFVHVASCSITYLLFLHTGVRPTITELISMKKKDGSRKKLRIIDEISSHDTSKCDDFAHNLLNDRLTVRRLRKKHKGDEEFVRAVFDSWLGRDDDEEDEDSLECSWESLVQCAEDSGLDGVFVKLLRDSVPRRK